MAIKAIETIYNGYRFRSRLEARWAVFFDALGVEYEYEPEGFDLGDGTFYLPDFRIKCWGTRGHLFDEPFDLWIEVKGEMARKDAEKIWKFVEMGWSNDRIDKFADFIPEHRVLVIGNIPDPNTYAAQASDLGSYESNGTNVYPWNYYTVDGDYFAAYPAVDNGRFYLDGDDCNYQTMDLKIIRDAFREARQARFEHGEKPHVKR